MPFARGALLGATLLVAACSTAAQRQAATVNDDLALAHQQQEACYAQLRGDPTAARVLGYIVDGPDDPEKLVKMSDQRLVDDYARQDLIELHRKLLPCRSAARDRFGAIDPAYARVLALTHDAEDGVLLALLNGQISVGEANQRLLEIDRLSDGARAQVTGTIGQRLAAADAAERQRRREAVGLALQQSYQQQQLANQQRLLNSLNRPTTTNCRAYGATINCNSF